jgi:hypothetical protein
MKRLVALSVCLLLAGATVANADILTGTGAVTSGNVSIGFTWDSNPSLTYDVVDIYLSGLSGNVAGAQVVTVEGAWTSTGGSFNVQGLDASSLVYKKHAADTLGTGNDSFVNMTQNGSAVWTRNGGTTNLTTLLRGGWMDGGMMEERLGVGAGDTDGDGYDENLIARMHVTKGTTMITFGGGANDKFGYTTGATQVTAFSVAVPEPTSLALLGCGLFGLLAYAWRKRK